MESDSIDDADKGGEWGELGEVGEYDEAGEHGGEDKGGSSVADTERQAMSLLRVSELVNSWAWFSILLISGSLKSNADKPIDSQILNDTNSGMKSEKVVFEMCYNHCYRLVIVCYIVYVRQRHGALSVLNSSASNLLLIQCYYRRNDLN